MDFDAILPLSVADAYTANRAFVGGELITIMCPDWCEADHIRDHADLSEIRHIGAGSGVSVPAGKGSQRLLLTTWEVSDSDGSPYAVVAPGDSLAPDDRLTFGAAQLRAFAAQLAEHAERMRSLAVRLSAAEQWLMP